MPKLADFLVEIQTEELPPKALRILAESFRDEIKKRLLETKLVFSDAIYYATPRRLAVLITDLAAKQSDCVNERRGPAWQAAFDAAGKPTPACVGFAKSCGVTPERLATIENAQGKWVGYQQKVSGKTVQQLIPTIIEQSLSALPIPKRMHWGNDSVMFVRPVHSVILLYGAKVIAATILGCKAGNTTLGHRFLCKKALKINAAKKYPAILAKQGFVIADFEKRKNKIRNDTAMLVKRSLGSQVKVVMDEKLLEEVTGIVEWPVALLGKFDKEFLRVPHEALISSMESHQRYFPLMDKNNKLLPYFVTISNIKSRKPKQVIAGNERVLRARLADAAFFYDVDRKIKLADRVEKLRDMVFQAKLGTLHDKAERIAKLAAVMLPDTPEARHAGLLAKADLTCDLVGEFPELQGIAGYYYALHDDEKSVVATAIKEHYQPRFSGDILPATELGCVIALADRIDTLTGIFSIGLLPTGDKDPYGLRRAALGVLRILIEKKMDLDLLDLLKQSLMYHAAQKTDAALINSIWNFMLDRLKPWYQDQDVSADVFAAVAALNITNPYDFDCRIQAVRAFKKLTDAEALSVANKRVSNILTQYNKPIQQQEIDINLFEHDAERDLVKALTQHNSQAASMVESAKYKEILTMLAKLREPVDAFFDHVMVMVDDQKKRENRLLILKKLRELFLKVADIALLQQ